MNSGYYAACTGLIARTEALDTIANNLANVGTAGFRASRNVFSSLLVANQDSQLSVLNQDANDYGVLSATQLDTSQGSMVSTGNELDLAIQGPGYFAVQTTSGIVYTRGGAFRVSPTSQLITAEGDRVLGDGNAPITLVGAPVSISSDGTISSNGAISGRLKLVEFAPGTQVKGIGGTYYTAPATAVVAPTGSQISQGMLEASNVNAITTSVELMNAQRELETMRHALSLMDGELDKTAVQDLPRV
jgi:flagellar basal-body rod protein FlgF/flagellar basal-body rod protein FlgG